MGHATAPLVAVLQPLIDRALALDPETRERLQALAAEHPGSLGVELQGTGLCLYLQPGERGLTLLAEPDEQGLTGWVRGAPLALLRAAAAPAGQRPPGVEVSGNTAEVNRLWGLIKGLSIDWEAALARVLGEGPAHTLGLGLHSGAERMDDTGQRLSSALGEYLTEESQLLPARAEMAVFLSDVDRLREDVDRLSARVQRLQRGRQA